MGRGRPPKGPNARSARILVCVEPGLREELVSMAEDSRRSISDYCHYVLEQHFWAVREEEGLVLRDEELSGAD